MEGEVMKSIPVELVNASRVGNTKQVKMRVDSKVEIDSPEFGQLDSLIGNIGLLIVGDDISETPSDSYVKEELSKVKIDKVIQGKSLARQFREAVWVALINLRDGEKPSEELSDQTYKAVMNYLISKTKDDPSWITRFTRE